MVLVGDAASHTSRTDGAQSRFAYPAPCLAVVSWTAKALTESSTTPGATNTITATIRPSTQLAATNTVVISGLTGSQTGDGSLAISGTDAAKFGNPATGAWIQDSGTLTLTVADGQTIASDADTVFQFDLTNPASAQAAVTPQIEASGGYGWWQPPGQDRCRRDPSLPHQREASYRAPQARHRRRKHRELT